MKRLRILGLAALMIPAALAAQRPTNPTTEAAQWTGSRLARYLESAADQVPSKLLSYKPTDAQMTFGQIWAHLAAANYGICSAIGGMEAPKQPERNGTESKETLVTALKGSFDFCDRAFANTDDSKLADKVSMGFMDGTRAQAMFIYVDDLADHYSQVANYMRLNGMLPPSARPRKNQRP